LQLTGSESLKATAAKDRLWRVGFVISVGGYSLGSGLGTH
jgi:hypothetical protein